MVSGKNILVGVRDDDSGATVAVFPFGALTYVAPGGTGTSDNDRIPLPVGYRLVVVHAVGGDAWVTQGTVTVTAAAPSAGAGLGRYLANGQELRLPSAGGAYLAARAITGTPTVYVYGVGS